MQNLKLTISREGGGVSGGWKTGGMTMLQFDFSALVGTNPIFGGEATLGVKNVAIRISITSVFNRLSIVTISGISNRFRKLFMVKDRRL